VVTTNVGGADEQFVNGKNGIICSHSVADIANAIEELLSSKDKRDLITLALKEENKINNENPFTSNIGLKDFWNIVEKIG
jgi:glycosyltransferase involved in cell wall biosynthesis